MLSILSSYIPMDENCWFMYVTACCACWTWGAIPSCNATLELPTSRSTSAAPSAHAAALLSRAQRMAMLMCGTQKQVSLVKLVWTDTLNTINNEYGFLFGVIGYFHFHFIYIIDGAHYFKPCGCSWASSPLWFYYYYTVLYFFFIVAKNKLETWSQRSNHQYLDEKLESVLNYLIWPC